MKKCNFGSLKDACDVHSIGSSSLKMHDEKVFDEFGIRERDFVLDLGCGPGDYSLKISELVGEKGKVFSVDQNKEVIDYFNERIKDKGILNIQTFVSDVKEGLPLGDDSVDVCVIITVLHALNIRDVAEDFFGEVKRVLRPGGKLITIDVKKGDSSFGPPMMMRISADELEEMLLRSGFEKRDLLDLGKTYMMKSEVAR